MTDQEIIELYWQRDQQAIAATEKAYGRRLKSLAGNLLFSSEDAEECVSDTYLKAWQTIPPARPTYLFAYLAKICRFAAFGRLDWQNAQKRKARVVELTEELAQCIPDAAADRQAEGEAIGRAMDAFLKGLPADKRRLFLRRYWFQQSIGDIAAAEGCGESRVKTSLHRMRKALQEHLEKEGISI